MFDDKVTVIGMLIMTCLTMRIRRTIDSVEVQMSRASNSNDWSGIGFSSNVFMGMDDIYYWYQSSVL